MGVIRFMDDFKRAKSDYITVWDLDCRYVSYKPKTRRQMAKIANRRAKRRLKRDIEKVFDIIKCFSAHGGLCAQQKNKED